MTSGITLFQVECLWELCELSLFLTLDSLTITFSCLFVSCANVIGKSLMVLLYSQSIWPRAWTTDLLHHIGREMVEVGEMLSDTKKSNIKEMV